MYTPHISGHTSLVLTARERQIVALLVEGCRNRDMARRFGTREQTVKNQLTKIFEKTGTTSRLELVLYAIKMGVAAPTAGARSRTVEQHTARPDVQ
jgi:DNA-binding NarL/FixJ family response regulator